MSNERERERERSKSSITSRLVKGLRNYKVVLEI